MAREIHRTDLMSLRREVSTSFQMRQAGMGKRKISSTWGKAELTLKGGSRKKESSTRESSTAQERHRAADSVSECTRSSAMAGSPVPRESTCNGERNCSL